MELASSVFTRQQARDFDRWAMQVIGIPGIVLMENAGRSAAAFATEKLDQLGGNKVFVICGTGNNGGDGLVIARHLINQARSVCVAIYGDPARLTDDTRLNMQVLQRLGQKIHIIDPVGPDPLQILSRLAGDSTILIDAILGTGLAGQVRPDIARLIHAVNALDRPILAVDIPSGLDCDTGLPLGAAIKARWTVTFAANKKGFLSPNARPYTGQVVVADIGISPMAWLEGTRQ